MSQAADAFFGIFGMTRVEAPLKLTTTIDVQLGRGQNMREGWHATAGRKDKEKKATKKALYAACENMERAAVPSLASCEQRGARITVVRPYSPSSGSMDGDNLSGSFKYPRDEIAAFLGVDDGSPRLHFIYTQAVAVKLGMSVKKGRTKASPDYDTRPTVTIEVMPVADIDPQVKRVRELEACLVQWCLQSRVQSDDALFTETVRLVDEVER